MAILARPTTCCYPACDAPPNTELDVPLCGRHCRHVYAAVASLLEPENVRAWLQAEAKTNPAPFEPECAVGYVYFVRMGDRVKIGHSRNPQKRFKQIPLEEVLAITIGSSSDEKAAHRRFAHLRTTGEWFKADPSLLAYAKALPRSA